MSDWQTIHTASALDALYLGASSIELTPHAANFVRQGDNGSLEHIVVFSSPRNFKFGYFAKRYSREAARWHLDGLAHQEGFLQAQAAFENAVADLAVLAQLPG
jgi:hypothetical protein